MVRHHTGLWMSVNSLDSIDRFDAALMNSRSVREIYKYMGVPDNAPYDDLFNQSAMDYGCFDTSVAPNHALE